MSTKIEAYYAHLKCSKNVELLLENLRKFLSKSENKLSLLISGNEQQPHVYEHFIYEQNAIGKFAEMLTIEVVGFLLMEQPNFVSTIDSKNLLARLDDLSLTVATNASIALREIKLMQPQRAIAAAIEEGIVEEIKETTVVDDHDKSTVTAAPEFQPIMQIPVYAQPDDILNVEIVAVKQINKYIGMIQTDAAAWYCTDEDIGSQQKLKDAPIIDQLLIAKYAVDGLWYRAKCLHVDVDNNAYEVIFVDYGNKELVQLHALAHPTAECVQQPFRLIILRLYNVQQSDDDKQKCDLGIQIANTMILKKTFKFKYLQQDAKGEVSLKALDDDFQWYLKLLAQTNIVKMLEI